MYERHYEYLTAIEQEKNISRAAERLYISQPSLSKFLINLENELGVKLFKRNKSAMELTSAGKEYLAYLKEIQHLNQSLMIKLNALKSNPDRCIRLGITPWISSLISAELIQEFQAACPGTHLALIEDYGIPLGTLFEQEKIDIILSMTGWAAHTNLEIYSAPVLQDRIILVVPKNHPTVQNYNLSENHILNPLFLTELPFQNCKIITGKSNHILYYKTQKIINTFNLQPSSIIETFNINNCLKMTESGLGISFTSQMYIENDVSLKHSFYFTMNHALFDCSRVLYYHKNADAPELHILIDTIRKVCSRYHINN